MKKYFKIICILFISRISFAAFEISPVTMTVTPSGTGASVSLVAMNTGDTKTPVQIAIFKREPDILGIEKYEPSAEIDEMFQIVPAQFILNPKEKRTVRITYVGDPKIKSEISVRVISEEFPINVTDASKVKNKAVASISILSKYVASLYVLPKDVNPKLTLEAKLTPDKKMEVIFKNEGAMHKLLNNVSYKAVSVTDKKEFDLTDTFKTAIGNQNILPGKSRKFVIAWPKDVPMTALKMIAADIEVKK